MPRNLINDTRKVLTLLPGFLFGIYVGAFLHELGHGLGVVLNGDRLFALVMQAPLPAGYPVASNPGSFLCVWGGVLFGTLFSLPALLLARILPAQSLGRFMALMTAAYCLAHNGLYLFAGSLAPFSDAAGMIGL